MKPFEDQIATVLYQGEGDVPLDYALFDYRRRMALSWEAVTHTPNWRIAQDLKYLALEAETPRRK